MMPKVTNIKDIIVNLKIEDTVDLTEQKREVRSFLALFNKLRVLVVSSPGLGHQATTINILHRLIKLGFSTLSKACQKEIEVIYETSKTYPTMLEKLAILFPLLDPKNPKPIILDGVKISFRSLDEFSQSPSPELIFGITGGFDISSKNLADLLNVRYFLKLEPFQWLQSNGLWLKNIPYPEGFINFEKVEYFGGDDYKLKTGYFVEDPFLTSEAIEKVCQNSKSSSKNNMYNLI